MSKIDYKSAGVDVTRGYEAVEAMKGHVAKTMIPGVLSAVGGFGGMFELPQGYKNPVLVSGTDGVGTKLNLAFRSNRHDTIGIDCVAMCVNDIVCLGAKPLFFLDYIGTGTLEPAQVADIVKGVSQGCVAAGCALIGGETAEMPGFYQKGEYDLAGFAVGVAEKDDLIDGSKIQAGDKIIGIASSGVHSNGFSLVRKLCFDVMNIRLEDYSEELQMTYEEALLTPTKIYVRLILDLIAKIPVHGIAHITGGGWIENLPRILPAGLKAVVAKDAVDKPKIFDLLQTWGNLEEADMYNTFNMGVGMMVVVPKEKVQEALAYLNTADKAWLIGEITEKTTEEEAIEIM